MVFECVIIVTKLFYWVNVEHCGASRSEVTMHRQCNMVAILSRVSEVVLSLFLCRHCSSMWSHYLSDEGRTIGTCYGNNGMRYEQPAELAMPATTYVPTYVLYRQNLTLNTLVWGSLTLSQILPNVTLGYYILVLIMTAPDWHTTLDS